LQFALVRGKKKLGTLVERADAVQRGNLFEGEGQLGGRVGSFLVELLQEYEGTINTAAGTGIAASCQSST
jgi:hypothetical protein